MRNVEKEGEEEEDHNKNENNSSDYVNNGDEPLDACVLGRNGISKLQLNKQK